MNLFQRGATPSPSIPSLTDVSPKLADLNKRRDELSSERRKLSEESLALAASEEPEADPREQRVAALLGRSAGGPSSRRTRLGEISQRTADIDLALERLYREIQEEQAAASVRVCGQVREEYRARITTYFAALLAAHKANEALQGLVDDLESAGVRTTSIRFDFSNPLGSPWDRHSQLAFALGEATKAGFVDRSDVPERFR